jgi:serine/threonine-protein kinase
MTPERWKHISQLYEASRLLPLGERAAFLAEACHGNASLQQEVQALLDQPTSPAALDGLRPAGIASVIEHGVAPPLTGRRFGAYLVQERIGEGGMGEVYRARDTKLGRDVAIKVLPTAFAQDPGRIARFEREARVLAALDHPHIGAIHGVEESDGIQALVLGFVAGETLAERLARGPLQVGDALEHAKQIAAALEAAHDKGIVHRDLKPANIKITPAGIVKVLDFGLAKADGVLLAEGPVEAQRARTSRSGLVLGTPGYMSPEQARGQPVDKRTDIWAFGCVLYEMLAGRPAFAGDTVSDTIAAILDREVDWGTLPDATPASVRRLLSRCLAKQTAHRLHDIADATLELDEAMTPAVSQAVAAARPLRRRAVPVLAALVAGAVITALAILVQEPRPVPQVTRLSLEATGSTALHVNGFERDLTITPDGSRVIYIGDRGRQIFVRALDNLEPQSLVTGAVLRNPFVSPDGQWVGFVEDLASLKKVPVAGGPAIFVAMIDGVIRGAAWLPDNTIVFATNRTAGLQRVSPGGTPTMLTRPDDARNEFTHLWPQLLPDGRALLYTVIARTGGLAAAKVRLLDLQTNRASDVLDGATNAMYVSSGHLAYVAGATLWAVPFDLDRRAVFGTAVPLLDQVVTTGNGAGLFAASTTGTLVYAHASGFNPLGRTLNWIDRQGRVETIPAPLEAYTQPRLSHDGTRVVAVVAREPEANLWVWDLTRRILTRITTDAALDIQPAWTPDDRWIVFASNRGGGRQSLWRQASDGSGNPERLTQTAFVQGTPTVTPDGQHVLFSQVTADGSRDIMLLTLATSQVTPVLRDRFTKNLAEVSPDGRWLAYNSNRSGRVEVYVQPYPITGAARWQISNGGGQSPTWARNGRELFYTTPDETLMSVSVQAAGTTWSAGQPVRVLEPGPWGFNTSRPSRHFDPAPDGRRFLVHGPPNTAPNPPLLVVAQHWDEELKSRVPAK